MSMKSKLMSAVAGAAFLAGAGAASAEEITVAYFLEWPMPFQYAKEMGTYDKEMGVKVNWRAFDTGTAMSAAMASGDVHLSVSQGVPPFVVATSAGQDLQTLDVAVSYADNDNCVVASALEIDKTNAAELAGKKVAVPLGTAAHYGFLKQMNHFGVDISTMDVVNMAPPEGAAAIAQGAVDMFCGWGGSLRRAKEHGNVLLTGAEKEELGILVFDVTSGPAAFVAENPDLVAKFLKVTADANAMWADPANRDTMLPVIAKDSGMDVEATAATIDTFVFPTVEEQLTAKWLGGGAQEFMKGVAEVFVEAGSIDSALATYENNVNTGPLAAANGM
ncbi:ABC-type taurine transport system, periplasmic component [Roseovarius mucosus DSM 17069]|uniref:ABC-type taurine transport system, periplasmic component n=1 Tax=Roseovarius mucosus DSM 17069 TaxID=1288298 RepID=A0A0A0HRZ5_9RHOB|nr:ABC transporter substrate-binding protein [Roseovarius mucosus]KGM89344.1 ABC-type taurine transport system, periplasmic component [Roseovarius mucosus DSM 17069]MBD12057.1 taurine ABC transporter substrate-binding protein [Roseovarius sp.]|tara:strand:+ start:60 stop:1058 length:999 start_codon:yes stop_codon:yes gene_type:complete